MVNVGVLSPVTGGFFFGEVLAGVVREVASVGGHVTLVQTLDAGQTSDEFEPSMAQTTVGWDSIDGFVAIAWATHAGYLDRLRAAGKPVVMVSNDLGAVDAATVVADNAGGVRTAVDHLVAHGHTRIGFLGNVAQSDIRERHEAYRATLGQHGLDPTGLFFGTKDHVETGGAEAADAVIEAMPGCTAVVAGTDRGALGLIGELTRRGIRVPEDLAVVGFDDAEAGWFARPPLATVRQSFAATGALAASLLVAELRGEPVEHRVYTQPATFVPRKSCGCGPRSISADPEAARGAQRLVAAVLDRLGLDETGERIPGATAPASVPLEALDEVILTALEQIHRPTAPPEALRSLTETYVGMLGDLLTRARDADKPWAGTLQYCVTRITSALAQLQMTGTLTRITRLSETLDEQYDVGMGLLGRVGSDPADLSWLEPLAVRAGYLGLWHDGPGGVELDIAGRFDRAGELTLPVGTSVPLTRFPPTDIVAAADTAAAEVTYVIPVRGSTGDHGFLAVIGTVDTEFGTGRAAYDHWAALLGSALREQHLLEDVRRSEQRYAFAAHAANDGLWDVDVATGTMYASPRCRDLLDLEADPDANTWTTSVHPDDREVVAAALDEATRDADQAVEQECRVLRRDGTTRWVLLRVVGVAEDSPTVTRLVGSLADIGQRKHLEEQLRQAALFDPVTGLPNRRLFLDRLSVALEQPRRRAGARFAVLFLDLDGFKLINDSLGHLAGDELLKVIGARLRAQLRSLDTAARFGGDEFAVLLTDPVPDELLVVAERLQQRISAPVMLGDTEVNVTASIGIAVSETGYLEAEDVLRDADIAMYHAKDVERGTASLFDPAMHKRAVSRLHIRTALQAALTDRQFVVHYQPVVALDGSPLSRLEALVRWEHPERGIIPPGDFLPAMEGNASIVSLGHWVLDEVCRQIAEWRTEFDGPLAVSVNLSHREFWARDLLDTIRATLARHDVPAESLILEITETVIMSDPDTAREVMDALHAMGITLHIDDFGTGQSSLHALRTFPVDALKIDGSFVRELPEVVQTTALVNTIIGMGDALGLSVVAECVETVSQAAELRRMGCNSAQGWLYAKAMPGADAGALLGTTLGPDREHVG